MGKGYAGYGKTHPPIAGLLWVALAAAAILLAYLLVQVLQWLPSALIVFLRAFPDRSDAATVTGLAALLVGVLLYVLRTKLRSVYAALELIFAVAAASTATTRLDAGDGILAVWIAFAGAAYLVVRSLDNFKIAREERAWPFQSGNAPAE